MTGTIRTLYPTYHATERGNFGTRPPHQHGKTALMGEAAIFATLRPSTGKPVEQHLRDLAAFWSADSAPHLLAKAALAAIERERQVTAQAMAEVKRLRKQLAEMPRPGLVVMQFPPQIKALHIPPGAMPFDPDTLAAELEDA